MIGTTNITAHGKGVSQDAILSLSCNLMDSIVISDGATSSLNSGFGAQVLVNTATWALRNLNKEIVEDPKEFVCAVVNNAKSIIQIAGFPSSVKKYRFENVAASVLDATLLVLARYKDTGRAFIYVFGDGSYFYRFKNKPLQLCTVISYSDSKASYPYFARDFAENRPYPYLTKKARYDRGDVVHEFEKPYDSVIQGLFEGLELELIGIASDGLTSFTNVSIMGSEPEDAHKMAELFTNFKTKVGNVVDIRVKASMKRMRQPTEGKHVTNIDDFTMGVMAT